MHQHFRAIGINYQKASLDLREKLAFQETTTKLFLRKLKEVQGINEALIVSTCNRTEIYFTSEQSNEKDVLKLLCLEKNLTLEKVAPSLSTYTHDEAINQLFRVSLGLESKVLGDLQIINQVKSAYQWSADENMAGPFLHHLMHSIFFANKRVIQETAFRDGSGSVASVAVSLIATVSGNLKEPRILLIGTGEIGQNVLENLGNNYSDISIMNRTKERALELARSRGYRVSDFENLYEEVNKADVIVGAISCSHPFITSTHLNNTLTPKLFIDLSVPRCMDEDIEKVSGVLLYNIDQISEKTSGVLEARKNAIPAVENILDEQIASFNEWSGEMSVSPTIRLLKEKLEQIRQDELAKHLKKLSTREVQLLENVTKSMIQKVIKLPVLELKAACKRGEADSLVEALNDIFNLENTSIEKS